MARPGIEMAERILSFLRDRGMPASSHMLAGRFLRASVGSEDLATRLLRGLLEPAGAVYAEGSGWTAPGRGTSRREAGPLVAAAVARGTGRVALAGVPPHEASAPGEAALEEATVVLLHPPADKPALLDWLHREGRPRPAAFVSLRSALRGAGRFPRDAGLEEFCAALGVRWLDSQTPEGAAAAMAACVAAACARRQEEAATGGAAGGEDLEEREPRLPAGISREALAGLPVTAGVYRFYDESGDLLYVGKAANLRRRVSSYFAPGALRRARRFYSRIHRMDFEAAGSELEALLAEAKWIASRAPAGNVQREVRERGARFHASRVFAILFPDRSSRGVTVLFVRDGRYLGRARVGPRGGGYDEARRLLRAALHGRPAKPRARRPADRDSWILASWLARHGESASRLELDSFRDVAAAALALEEALRAIRAEPGAALFR